MPLSRLENFLINTDGNILYVNPSDLDATDSFDNKGNSLTRPFKTLQRALIEAARFSYQIGDSNDRFDRTTVLLYPGTHTIDNRPGFFVKNNGGSPQYFDQNESIVASPNIELTNSSIFDLDNASNVLYKFNSVDGGLIVPKGTSIVGLDLRKTKIRPLYVPDPENTTIERSALFRVTGGCYFWQFSMFDANQAVFFNKNYSQKANPSFSHHKLTCFEYADGVNVKSLTGLSDLQMYYFKLMNAYGADTGNREITDFPTSTDFQPNSPEFKIVGDLSANDFNVSELTSSGTIASVTTGIKHNLNVDDSFRVIGVGSDTYNGSFKVTGITSERKFTYSMLADPTDDVITIGGNEKIVIEADNVTGASPYIFNLSLRSAFGMCGLHADGSKATGFKSMVVAQFTGIGLQKDPKAFLIYNETTGQYDTNDTAPNTVTKPLYINQEAVYNPNYESFHVKASNDSVIQAVSVFAIGFANHFLTEDGADQSITNSNSNFGAKSLISKGFRNQSFDRDNTGYITHIIPPKDSQEQTNNVTWRPLDPSTTIGIGITSRLYILGETDEGNPPSNISEGFRIGARENEVVYLDTNIAGITSTFNSPVLMQVPSGDGPSSKKEFTVTRTLNINDIDISTNVITLNDNHTFFNGESIRIFSDNGVLPDGIEPEGAYFAITGGTLGTDEIKIANSVNNAVNGSAVDIKNTNGGILTVLSRVTDKLPGELGHPIQYDSINSNWYISSSNTVTTNKIYEKFVGFSTQIAASNSSSYVQRIPENRDLSNRIYKLRYVIPKDFSNAKAPTKNFILQESKTVTEETVINDVNSNRNPRIIANISTSGSDVVNVTSEKPHGLFVDDRVRLKNIKSSTNTDGTAEQGYNGYFFVKTVTGTNTFTVQNANGGTFIDNISTRNSNLPSFEKNEYNTTYIIQDVDTLQPYEDGVQDGIYYLTCLLSNISPTVSQFAHQKFKQNFRYLYPTVDRDNTVVDPNQTVSAASNKLIGKVAVNDPLNSITKESVIEYIKDNRIGVGITGAIYDSGTVRYYTERNHGFSKVTKLSLTSEGSNYGPGVSTTLYNVALTGGTGTGDGATANIAVSAAGTITSVSIVDGGSAYGVGNTMSVSGGDAGVVTINNVSREDLLGFQVIGVGTVSNRNSSNYNGVFFAPSFPSSTEVSFAATTSTVTNPGIYTTSSGVLFPVEQRSQISTIVGAAGTTLSGICTVTTAVEHGLAVGNRVKLEGFLQSEEISAYNKEFIVKEVVGLSTFTINAVFTPKVTANVGVIKIGFGAYGEDTSLQNEKISGSLLSISAGLSIKTSSGINTTSTILLVTANDHSETIEQGNFLQIEDEIVRIKSVDSNTQFTVIRGVMGTIAKPHVSGVIAKGIKVIPSEVRRFSSIRASGHTFEYIGYGPGNYSTALPQRIQRTLTSEEELLSIYCEKKGGVTFFSGMNDRGEFFTWDGRIKPVEKYISEVGNDFTGIFDDLYVRNTLRVGGGLNRNLPSEFRGPVNFTNKITSLDTVNGINAIKLQLKGNVQANPFFQVGSDSSPSLVVNQSSGKVGIKTATPQFELDVSGTVRADIYENFKLSDLPNTTSEESTFAKNRVLKVNSTGDGYELVDINTLDAFSLSSYGVSNDGTVYVGTGSTVSNKLQISGISTSKFAVGEKVKLFGVNQSSDSVLSPGIPAVPTFTRVGTAATAKTYRYWVAQYHMRTGKVGVGTQITPDAGVGHATIDNFNDQNHIIITLNRSDTNHGILVYRQESAVGAPANINDAHLVGILGPKELENSTAGITYKDYGTYDQTEWSSNGNKNQFDDDQIHFPSIATTGQRRGWAMDEIVSIGANSITVNNPYDFNNAVGFGTDNNVKVVHDNTYGLTLAVNDILAKGGSYLNIPSGTYLAEKLVLPTSFTIKGSGKNTILKQQYYATDATDGAGNSLAFDNNFVGIGVTNGTDITIDNLTIDGNNSNNIRFESDDDNYMVYFRGVSSSLFKNIELRNSPAHGLLIKESTRVSIENSSFVDGSITDRYAYEPINAQESQVLRINDSLFENYPGPVDVSVTSVVSTGGNIIRNCGTGLRTYATGKITTSNNIILGPSDEFIPSPDIYDSDFNSINITIDRAADFVGPVLQYIEDGDAKDISSSKVTIVSAGIGTIVGQGTTNETLGTRFVDFDITTQDTGEFGRESGYINLSMPLSKTSQIGLTSALGYNIIAQEYLDLPSGISTYIGISTGAWNTIGAGATEYTVTLTKPENLDIISLGDVVKLVSHSSTPNLSSKVLTVADKITVDIVTKQVKLTGFTTTSQINGDESGYIVIRKQFVIAKGRVGVI
jgi:hypothetical protein